MKRLDRLAHAFTLATVVTAGLAALTVAAGCGSTVKTPGTDGGKGKDLAGTGGTGDLAGTAGQDGGGNGGTDDAGGNGTGDDDGGSNGNLDLSAVTTVDLAVPPVDAAVAPDLAMVVSVVDAAIPPADLAVSIDATVVGNPDLAKASVQDLAVKPVGSDGAVSSGDGGGGCVQIATWPGFYPAGSFDPMNVYTTAGSANLATPPFLGLTVEDWHAMGVTYPKVVTFSAADNYSTCDVCPVMVDCTAMSCQRALFAQSGSVTVTRADQNEASGVMQATVTNLKLVEWDFAMSDAPIPGGRCYIVGSATFNVSWGQPDGGTSIPDGGSPQPDGAAPSPDLVMSGPPSDGGGATADLYCPTAACAPVINELQTTGLKASDEFVEIYNPCPGAVDLTGWKLDYRSAGNNSGGNDNLLFNFSTMIPAGGYLVIGGSSYLGPTDGTFRSGGLAGAGGAVALRNSCGALVDKVSYNVLTATNNFTETAPAPNPPKLSSISRHPNGHDSDDNSADFQVTATPTPKAANP